MRLAVGMFGDDGRRMWNCGNVTQKITPMTDMPTSAWVMGVLVSAYWKAVNFWTFR